MKEKEGAKVCRCPYCNQPVSGETEFCQPCGVKIIRCPACKKPLPKGVTTCPECGEKL
ncbi:MAG: zinc ribbon domain-containing protein [candidate division WOR-3 bacterium]